MLRGRRDECAALEGLVQRIRVAESAVLVLRGEAGIGKTALVEFVAAQATGCRVERAVGVQAAMELAFVASRLQDAARHPARQRGRWNGGDEHEGQGEPADAESLRRPPTRRRRRRA
jgi:predicted ATPase